MSKTIQIPAAFQKAPFYVGKKELQYEKMPFSQELEHFFFLYEIAALQGEEARKPWAEKEVAVPAVLESWKQHNGKIAHLFRERKRTEAKEPMVRYAAHFLSALYWMNDSRISSLEHMQEELEKLPVKPVNIAERIGFILEQPGHYHSFIQLSQLYEELEKLFAKMLLIQKKTSPQ
ncbi:MAG: YpoC family protein [Ectobacillus sp.]